MNIRNHRLLAAWLGLLLVLLLQLPAAWAQANTPSPASSEPIKPVAPFYSV
ncbi:hypothetical protein [Nevskia ramosa]|uniref:hypothetical protein n=1 Tax=Nevskia ramosa TaxID=64002 RepID=UPI003D0A5EF2